MTASFLRSERVYLRAFEPEDAPALHAYLNHPAMTGRRYIPWDFPNELPLSRAQADAIISKWAEGKKQFHLAVIAVDNEKFIGHASADWGWDPHCPHISVAIAPDDQRQGFGCEVLNVLLTYVFENTPAHNIGGGFASWNEAGRHFATSQGFRQTGQMRRVGLKDGVYFDWVGVDILRPEWLAQRGA